MQKVQDFTVRVSTSGSGKRTFLSLNRSDWFWNPFSLYFGGFQGGGRGGGVFLPGKAAGIQTVAKFRINGAGLSL